MSHIKWSVKLDFLPFSYENNEQVITYIYSHCKIVMSLKAFNDSVLAPNMFLTIRLLNNLRPKLTLLYQTEDNQSKNDIKQ